MKNKYRIIIYVGLVAAFAAIIQIKKHQVTADREKTVVSIPNEIKAHGYPVDLEALQKRSLFRALRVTATKEKGRLYHFWLGKKDIALAKQGQVIHSVKTRNPIGKTTAIAQRIALTTGLHKVNFTLNPDEKEDLTNTHLAIDLILEEYLKVTSIPEEAIDRSFKPGKNIVWVNENNKASPIEVTIGRSGQGRVEITQGLEAGAQVVVNGHHALFQGALLRTRKCLGCESLIGGTK